MAYKAVEGEVNVREVRRLMESRGWRPERLSVESGIPMPTIVALLGPASGTAENRPVLSTTIAPLARALGVAIEEILCG